MILSDTTSHCLIGSCVLMRYVYPTTFLKCPPRRQQTFQLMPSTEFLIFPSATWLIFSTTSLLIRGHGNSFLPVAVIQSFGLSFCLLFFSWLKSNPSKSLLTLPSQPTQHWSHHTTSCASTLVSGHSISPLDYYNWSPASTHRQELASKTLS